VPSLDGSPAVRFDDAAGVARFARLTTFLRGRAQPTVASTPALRRRLGETFAHLRLALANFSHSGADRLVLWDIRRAAQVRELALEIEDRGRRDRLLAVFDRFESSLLPRLDPLRRQFLHNDLTGGNVLIGPEGTEVVGLIDFGDATVTQVVNDLAIAATEQLADGPDPLGPALDLVVAYHRVAALEVEELSLLYELVRTRTAALIAITEWRAERFPENRDYILRKTPRAWFLLGAMEPGAAGNVGNRLRAACGYR
jgi:hydroxylysine kinase